jgi:hypothetical protein
VAPRVLVKGAAIKKKLTLKRHSASLVQKRTTASYWVMTPMVDARPTRVRYKDGPMSYPNLIVSDNTASCSVEEVEYVQEEKGCMLGLQALEIAT